VKRIALVSDDPGAGVAGCRSCDNLTLHHRDELDALMCELRETPGTTVIVYEQTCAAEKRRRRKEGAARGSGEAPVHQRCGLRGLR
jgi:indolepyruvate ferredoxin oxidoreductase